MPGVSFACKPSGMALRRILKDYNMPLSKSIMVGDQLFTDIVMANAMNIQSIFVEPIDVPHCSIMKRFQYKIQDYCLGRLS